MIRKLFATTAVATLIATGAIAQSDPMDNTLMDMPVFDRDATMQTEMDADGYVEASTDQVLSSNLLGKQIYTGTSDDAEVVGDVNDLLIAMNGDAQAVVVGVGGFLGMGEKEVAVDFSRLNWVEMDGERRLFMSTTVEELENAPAFDRSIVTVDRMEAANLDSGIYNETPDPIEPALPGAAVPEDADGIDTMTTASTDRMENMEVLDPATLSADELMGARVYGSDNTDLGEIGNVLISDGGKDIKAYIVDVGGFLGIGEKPVALGAENLQIVADANGTISVHTPFTEEQLNNQPTYTEEAYRDNPDLILVQ